MCLHFESAHGFMGNYLKYHRSCFYFFVFVLIRADGKKYFYTLFIYWYSTFFYFTLILSFSRHFFLILLCLVLQIILCTIHE